MKKIITTFQTRVEVFVGAGFVAALIYAIVHNSIVHGTYSSPW